MMASSPDKTFLFSNNHTPNPPKQKNQVTRCLLLLLGGLLLRSGLLLLGRGFLFRCRLLDRFLLGRSFLLRSGLLLGRCFLLSSGLLLWRCLFRLRFFGSAFQTIWNKNCQLRESGAQTDLGNEKFEENETYMITYAAFLASAESL